MSALPRLLAGVRPGRAMGLAEHVERHGPVAAAPLRGGPLIDAVAVAGLRGRGGAAFPTAVKLRAVAQRAGRRAVVVNGAEGEPMSAKDRVLLELAPHLVLDGALMAAEAVGARDVVIAVKRSAHGAHAALGHALAERRDAGRVRVEGVPGGFVAGEETALLHGLNGGPAKPTLTPPRPYERGLGRRATLVANVETLAHVALIARHGPAWFRELGAEQHPGSALVTLAGAVTRPGVHEVALGTPIARLIAAGGPAPPARAVLVGGYYGSWLTGDALAATGLDDVSLRARGAALGAGVVVALPEGACAVAEVARVVGWLAGETAGQCGPCVHGLDAIAGTLAAIADGAADKYAMRRLERWCGQVEGRGACHHPNGVAGFVRSALRVFAAELGDHRRHGPCDDCDRRPVLLVPDPGERLAA
jgi:NADH:ubiquinone oxidoreductase subunit F (NADH-binding)